MGGDGGMGWIVMGGGGGDGRDGVDGVDGDGGRGGGERGRVKEGGSVEWESGLKRG